MNKGIIKSTFREIKTSFGRYMAILLIISLGVGFFSGLKVAYEVMVYSADGYYNELDFYDYQLLSTMGFDEDSAGQLLEEADVAAAEGSKSADVIMTEEDGTENVIKTMSLPEDVNTLELLAGRMPENKNECLADSGKYSESDIGKTIVVSQSNEEDDWDLFAVKEYTIVGVVRSPLYAVYHRGNTALGSGSIEAFIYIMDEAYDMDYDTEIYVRFEKDTYIYSDEYEDFIESKEDTWEEITQNVADARYNRIYADAQEELDDADRELAEKKAEGEQELGDALADLDDGRKQIEDGEYELTKAKNTLAENEKTFEEKEEEYQKGIKEYDKNKKEFDKGKKEYQKAVKEYESQYEAYEKSLAEYEAGKAAYDESELQYQAAKEQYDAGKQYLSAEEQAVKEQEFAAWRATLDQTKIALDSAKEQLDVAKASFDTAKTTLDTEGEKIAKAEKQLKNAKKELDEGGKQIEEAKEQFASARSRISQSEQDLAEARQELEDGQAEYDDAKAEYDEKIADAEDELADARKELEDLDKPEVYVLGRNTNTGYAGYESDSAIIEGVARVFPIFFFLVAALVCMTTMTRMVEEQRTQIGVLKALGYSNGAIIGKYMTYSGSAALIGSLVGYVAGTWIFSVVIWTAYKMMYDFGDMRYVWDLQLAAGCTLVAFLCSAGTTFAVCFQELRDMAATLMRPKAPKVGKRVLLERIPFVWNHLKFLDKVSVRNLFRYKKRFFMMIIGVSGCTALLVAGMGVRDSISTIADTQYETISYYDLIATADKEVSVSGMKEFMQMMSASVDMTSGNTVSSVNILVPKDMSQFGSYMNLHTSEGVEIATPDKQEIVMSYKLADKFGVNVGDEITLQNEDMKGGTVVVSGIYESFMDHYVILQPDTYQQLFGETAEYNQLFINLEKNAVVDEVAASLMKEDDVTHVTTSEDIQAQISDMMVSLDYVVILVIACAAMLAFVVIYNLNNINITERIREIATIKVLGFYKDETHSYVFRENSVLTLIGSLCGALLGYYLHAFVMDQVQVDGVAFDVHVEPLSFVLSVVFTLIFNQIVNLFMSGKLERIDMAESLKSVE